MQNSEFRIQTRYVTNDGVESAAIVRVFWVTGTVCILHCAF